MFAVAWLTGRHGDPPDQALARLDPLLTPELAAQLAADPRPLPALQLPAGTDATFTAQATQATEDDVGVLLVIGRRAVTSRADGPAPDAWAVVTVTVRVVDTAEGPRVAEIVETAL